LSKGLHKVIGGGDSSVLQLGRELTDLCVNFVSADSSVMGNLVIDSRDTENHAGWRRAKVNPAEPGNTTFR